MSFPIFPTISVSLSIPTAQVANLLLASIAIEELSLAHLINAEAEKVQFVLGTLAGARTLTPSTVTLSNVLDINTSVRRTLRDVIKKEMLLEFKFENILELISVPGVITPIPPGAACGCNLDFSIHRGAGATSDVTLNGDPRAGAIDFVGVFCPQCTVNANTFTFTFNPTGGGPTDISTFVANPNTFVVPNCPTGDVTIGPGTGLLTGPLASTISPNLGPNPTFTLQVSFAGAAPTRVITLTLTGNGNTFIAKNTNGIGNEEFDISNCP